METNEILDRAKQTKAWEWRPLIEMTGDGEYRPSKHITKQCVYEALYEVQELFCAMKRADETPPGYRYIKLTDDALRAISTALMDSIIMRGPVEAACQEKCLDSLIRIRTHALDGAELRYRDRRDEGNGIDHPQN